MITAIDHIVILVDDLAAAMADYRQLGFQVVVGGEHTDGATHNALVSFADGSYLELLAFQREAPEHRWWRHRAAGPGLIDFALLPETIAADVAAARERGLAIVGPLPGGRARPDGVRIEWQTALPERPELPFLCGDVTPRALRVPGPEAQNHPNRAHGIGAVAVAVTDIQASADAYAALLGQQPTVEPDRRSFRLGAASIVLLAGPAATRGAGIYALTLVGPGAAPFALDPALAHGVRSNF